MITLFSQERIQKIYEKELIESCTAEAMEKGILAMLTDLVR